jgi:hypothetical protein
MGNYLSLGPVRLRVSSRHLAPWGYEWFGIYGLSLFSHSNSGEFILASYHPRKSITWIWSLAIGKRRDNWNWIDRAKMRSGQWHDYYWLPFNRELRVSRQNYHSIFPAKPLDN